MNSSAAEKNRGKQLMTVTAWDKPRTASHQDILEILEQNAKWWEHAARTCETTAVRDPAGSSEEWQLMGAVYRERAEKVAQFIAQLSKKGDER